MQNHLKWVAMGIIAILGACDGGTPPATQPSTAAKIKEDLQQMGQTAKDKAEELKDKAEPALEDAGNRVKEGVHDLAQKVADRTATTSPATQQ